MRARSPPLCGACTVSCVVPRCPVALVPSPVRCVAVCFCTEPAVASARQLVVLLPSVTAPLSMLGFGRLLTHPECTTTRTESPTFRTRRARPVGLSDFAVGYRASVGASIWEALDASQVHDDSDRVPDFPHSPHSSRRPE